MNNWELLPDMLLDMCTAACIGLPPPREMQCEKCASIFNFCISCWAEPGKLGRLVTAEAVSFTSRPAQCEFFWLARGSDSMMMGCFSNADEIIHPYVLMWTFSACSCACAVLHSEMDGCSAFRWSWRARRVSFFSGGMSVCCRARTGIWLGADVHVNDYGYDNDSTVMQGDNCYVNGADDECLTTAAMMIITIVVLRASVIR